MNERKGAVRPAARELREIRFEERGEVTEKAARPMRALGVRVVVAGDEADALGVKAQLVEKEALDEVKLALEGEVGYVAGDDHVVYVHAPDGAGGGVDRERLMDCVPPKAEVDVAGEALVQQPMGEGSLEREQVKVRQVSDPHRRSMRRMSIDRQTSRCGMERRSAAMPDGIGTGPKVLEKAVRNATGEVVEAAMGRAAECGGGRIESRGWGGEPRERRGFGRLRGATGARSRRIRP